MESHNAECSAILIGRATACYRSRLTLRPGTCYFGAYQASSISDPTGSYGLDQYEAAHEASLSRPVPLSDYLAYGGSNVRRFQTWIVER
jgi:hypothetical protein